MRNRVTLRLSGIFIFFLTVSMIQADSSFPRENRETSWGDCPYDSFFNGILAVINGSSKTVTGNNCFIVRIYDEPEEYGSGNRKYFKILSFYCQYGHKGTSDGENCFGLLYPNFMKFLKNKGYSVKQVEDYSMTGWINRVYEASRKNNAFLFIFESESTASMGYAKISIVR